MKLAGQMMRITSFVNKAIIMLCEVYHYPKLYPIALRLSVLSIQSADVERVCKAHKVIHSKVRNRLITKTVQMLLFTYVNLRLLHKCSEPIVEFLLSCLEEETASAEQSDVIVIDDHFDV